MAHCGIASRRKAAGLLLGGRVRVNGAIIREKGFRVDTENDRIELDGRPIDTEKKVYYLLNKPKGIITTACDEKGRVTVLDLIPESQHKRIYPVGRLDKDTEGLLLLTNDGALAHRLTHPRFGAEKKYMVYIKSKIDPERVRKLEKGVYIEGGKTAPCKATIIDDKRGKTCLEIALHEGKKRQIRRMIEKIGGKVGRLDRVGYAGLTTRGLKRGAYRHLTKAEISRLRGEREDNA